MYTVMYCYPNKDKFWSHYKDTLSLEDAEMMLSDLLENQIRLNGDMMIAQLLSSDIPVSVKGISGKNIIEGHVVVIPSMDMGINTIELFLRSGWYTSDNKSLYKSFFYFADFVNEIKMFARYGHDLMGSIFNSDIKSV